MKVAYADPPYLGCAKKHYGSLHPDASAYDRVEAHEALIERLCCEYDAWAMSLTSTTLRVILPLCPDDVRVGAWTKPFCSFKPGVNPAYAWEPVIFRGARKRAKKETKVRDYCAVSITLMAGFPGAKPAPFCWWVFDFLGLTPEDEFTDLFPGSGAVTRAWDSWCKTYEGIFPLVEANP